MSLSIKKKSYLFQISLIDSVEGVEFGAINVEDGDDVGVGVGIGIGVGIGVSFAADRDDYLAVGGR